MHDTTINSHSGLELIKVHSKEDKLLTLGNALHYDPSNLNFDELTEEKKHIILPVCRKRCFMNLINRRKELEKIDNVVTKKEKTMMNSSSKSPLPQYIHWDKDGSIWTKSSEEVVVDWL
jgi:hypothetical protein